MKKICFLDVSQRGEFDFDNDFFFRGHHYFVLDVYGKFLMYTANFLMYTAKFSENPKTRKHIFEKKKMGLG